MTSLSLGGEWAKWPWWTRHPVCMDRQPGRTRNHPTGEFLTRDSTNHLCRGFAALRPEVLFEDAREILDIHTSRSTNPRTPFAFMAHPPPPPQKSPAHKLWILGNLLIPPTSLGCNHLNPENPYLFLG